MPASVSLYHSAQMVRELIDEAHAWPRYETVYGELLVSPAPKLWHQEVVARLLVALREFCARVGGMQAFASPADISSGDDTLVQPDVFVVPLDEARTLDWRQVKTPLLAAEVLSPSSGRRSVRPKILQYPVPRTLPLPLTPCPLPASAPSPAAR